LAIDDVRTMDMRIADSLIARRSPAILAAIVSAVTLLLAIIGTYGVLSYTIAQRRREIGIRMAVGAAPSTVLALVMKQGLQLTILGIVVGLAGAVGLNRVIASLLYGVAPTDPAAMVAVTTTIALAAAAACAVPGWRASRLDPNMALRGE
jgi:ABC-type antimicrobial peptide transport system permease subunit